MRITGGILTLALEKRAGHVDSVPPPLTTHRFGDERGELAIKSHALKALANLIVAGTGAGLGGLLGGAAAPGGHRLEGARRGALTALGGLGGVYAGSAVGDHFGSGLGGAVGAAGGGLTGGYPGAGAGLSLGSLAGGSIGSASGVGLGGVIGGKTVQHLMGDPSWKRKRDGKGDSKKSEKAAALARTLRRR